MKKITQEEFEKRVENVQHGQYEVLGKYKNQTSKIKVKCLYCSKVMDLLAKNLMIKRVGKNCNHHLPLTENEVKARISKASNYNIEMIGKYKGARVKTQMHCKKCDYKWNTEPYVIYSDHGCPNCSQKARVTDQVFEKFLRENATDYELVGNIVSSKKAVKILHKTCGTVFEMTPHNFMISGQRCPNEAYIKASNNRAYSFREMNDILQKATNGAYEIVKDYKRANINAICSHVKCGHTFKAHPGQLSRGETGCPYCASSKDEKAVRIYLTQHGFTFKEQVKFDDCKLTRPLPFDFGIYEGNKLKALIEYQGIQHYKYNELFDKNDPLKDRKKRDHIKRNWCKQHNIPLIEIPYKNRRSSLTEIKKTVKFYLDRKLIPNQALVKTKEGVTTR